VLTVNRTSSFVIAVGLLATMTGAKAGSCWGTNTPPDAFVAGNRFLVEGMVFHDVNRNGVLDNYDGETGIANRDVFIVDEGATYQDGDDQILAVTTTDASGWFRVGVRPPSGTDLSDALAVSIRDASDYTRLSSSFAYRVLMPDMAEVDSRQVVCLQYDPGFWSKAFALMPQEEEAGFASIPPAHRRHFFELTMRERVAALVEIKYRDLDVEVYRPGPFESCDDAPARTQLIKFHPGCAPGEPSIQSGECPTAGSTLPMTANHYLDVGNRLANDEVNVYWGGIFTVTERFYLFDEPSTYVERGEDIARAIANVTVHELGHALGLVPEPFPDAHFGHNYEYTGSWITVPPFSGPHALAVGSGRGGSSVIPPQQRWIMAVRA